MSLEAKMAGHGKKGIEKKIEELDFSELGHKAGDERVQRKVTEKAEGLDSLYTELKQDLMRKGLYEENVEAQEGAPEGIKIAKAKPIPDQMITEEITDMLGMYLAESHSVGKKINERIKEIKGKISGEIKLEKDDTVDSLNEELRIARGELQNLGYDWDRVRSHLRDRGLDDELAAAIKDSYVRTAPVHEASKYLNRIQAEHREELVKHLAFAHSRFDYNELMRRELNELKNIFLTYYSLNQRHVGKPDIVEQEIKKQLGHLYKAEHKESTHVPKYSSHKKAA